MGTIYGREPVLIVGALMALITLGVAFGLDLTGKQIAAIEVAATAVLALVARQSVYSPATVAKRERPKGEVSGDALVDPEV